MLYGIGIYRGEKTATGIKLVTILNCDDEEQIGTQWCNDQILMRDRAYVVKFELADQFCHAISMADLQKLGV